MTSTAKPKGLGSVLGAVAKNRDGSPSAVSESSVSPVEQRNSPPPGAAMMGAAAGAKYQTKTGVDGDAAPIGGAGKAKGGGFAALARASSGEDSPGAASEGDKMDKLTNMFGPKKKAIDATTGDSSATEGKPKPPNPFLMARGAPNPASPTSDGPSSPMAKASGGTLSLTSALVAKKAAARIKEKAKKLRDEKLKKMSEMPELTDNIVKQRKAMRARKDVRAY
ncbi:unnamed protein product [Amoebophrya sp. A25]|nr:unnamed protein product [Amoebophrya sp. A25]|eukprot:GSA25T00020054001.1